LESKGKMPILSVFMRLSGTFHSANIGWKLENLGCNDWSRNYIFDGGPGAALKALKKGQLKPMN